MPDPQLSRFSRMTLRIFQPSLLASAFHSSVYKQAEGEAKGLSTEDTHRLHAVVFVGAFLSSLL